MPANPASTAQSTKHTILTNPVDTPSAAAASICPPVALIQLPKLVSDSSADAIDLDGEAVLCAARRGELASLTRLWGYEAAVVQHPRCITRGDPACIYGIAWKTGRPHVHAVVAAGASFVGCGAAVGLAGGWVAGAIAAGLGCVLGGAAGVLRDRGIDPFRGLS